MSSGCSCHGGQAQGLCATEFQYAVKVVCGEQKALDFSPVAPGRYWTAVNVHNPDKCKEANFWLKVGVAQFSLQSPVTRFFGPIPLRPDGMVEFDCWIIRWIVGGLFPAPQTTPAFIKGFMVIESDIELDVVAVYSGSAGSVGAAGGNSFHTERVPARCVSVCDDLVLPLNTGFANWQTVSPTAGPVVTLSNLNSNWVQPQFGFTWVSQLGSDSSNAPAGWRRYEFCFNLCDRFITPSTATPIHVLVDNTAEVSLNGSGAVGSTGNVGTISGSGNYSNPHTLNIPPGLFRPGRNCLQVDVNNAVQATNNPTGFALNGILNIPRGHCPCAPLPIAKPRTGDVHQAAMALFAQMEEHQKRSREKS
jgi:hypothetical protein